jgi:hypothetical protein
LKRFWIGLLLLVSSADTSAQTVDTATVTARYRVEITDMSLLKSSLVLIGRIFGVVPKELEYRETYIIRCGSDNFQMALGNSSRRWLEVFSDTTRFSFIDPPAFPLQSLRKDTLRSDAIRFISGIRGFFRDGSAGALRGRFVLWKDTVDFNVTRDPSRPLLYWISSRNQAGKRYIEGNVLVGRRAGVVVYPRMELHLLAAGAKVTLEMDSLRVEK